uniref:Kazal-like domain-containing protein n=1 Tax=Clastoptera arizonana TaxID=38151 RepID=A0A1B6C0D7_9HEMI
MRFASSNMKCVLLPFVVVLLTVQDSLSQAPCFHLCAKDYFPICAYGKNSEGVEHYKTFPNACTMDASNHCEKTAYKLSQLGLCKVLPSTTEQDNIYNQLVFKD